MAPPGRLPPLGTPVWQLLAFRHSFFTCPLGFHKAFYSANMTGDFFKLRFQARGFLASGPEVSAEDLNSRFLSYFLTSTSTKITESPFVALKGKQILWAQCGPVKKFNQIPNCLWGEVSYTCLAGGTLEAVLLKDVTSVLKQVYLKEGRGRSQQGKITRKALFCKGQCKGMNTPMYLIDPSII